jgi:hypothetical protein
LGKPILPQEAIPKLQISDRSEFKFFLNKIPACTLMNCGANTLSITPEFAKKLQLETYKRDIPESKLPRGFSGEILVKESHITDFFLNGI